MLAAVSVIPGIVKVRAALIGAGCVGLLALPWLLFAGSPPIAAATQGVLALLGLYILWCYWPDWTLGISRRHLASLPLPPGQRLRLTFDDGPTAGLTERILDLLQEHGIKASFFVLVQKARAHPALIRRIIAEGHILGLHGADHRPPFFRSAAELQHSLVHARVELERIAGRPIDLYRPSHGWKTLALIAAARAAKLRLCFWDRGVWDTDAPPGPVLEGRLHQVMRAARAEVPVILLHDGLDDFLDVPPHAGALLGALQRWLPLMRTQHQEQ
jgi:peptidoglycan/xylan/chitin deacetylase (PgdA/CDA1 family)